MDEIFNVNEQEEICRICFKDIKIKFDGCNSFEAFIKIMEEFDKSYEDYLLWKFVGFV